MKDWSKYQGDIFSTYTDENCNIAVHAGPGSGKTTVLKQLCKLTPYHISSVFLAFNKSIVEELRESLPDHVQVSTMHSMGCKAIFRTYGKVSIDSNKNFKILKKLEYDKDFKETLKDVKSVNMYFYDVSKIYDLARMNLVNEIPKMLNIADDYGIVTNKYTEYHLSVLIDKINQANKKLSVIDFVDMIYLPVSQKLSMYKFDRVFVDEAQDLNACQHALLDLILKRNSKLVTVGDPYQSIYTFLGADVNSFQKLSNRNNTKVLPLSISYRCPRSVVDEVNKVFNVVEVFDKAKDGIVREGEFKEIEVGDMVLCRNNKPLAIAFLRLIRRGIKAYIRGDDIGKGILKLIKPHRHMSVYACIDKLEEELDDLGKRLRERGITVPSHHPSHVLFRENIDVFRILSEDYNKVSEAIPFIESIFKSDGEGVMLSTIHKAKGLEANRVFLLNPELIPSKYAVKAWQKDQEQKLKFVALSRAKEELIYVRNFK